MKLNSVSGNQYLKGEYSHFPSLYLTYLKNTLDNNRTYVNDDMHKIGNMLTNPTLIAPDTEDELYVVWDN